MQRITNNPGPRHRPGAQGTKSHQITDNHTDSTQVTPHHTNHTDITQITQTYHRPKKVDTKRRFQKRQIRNRQFIQKGADEESCVICVMFV